MHNFSLDTLLRKNKVILSLGAIAYSYTEASYAFAQRVADKHLLEK
ncbi:hypothetical protein H6G94_31875 [Nostoc punctiforme FACHB-252]|uniref:Uncharacterized protein n=1 Tax=Nostoc punctiforme FACHB-252 TaxID=1357509 RepID=A0ABR8HJP7_NOSPU|nr:hypothetical protein [Nostoc punctiforme]MBD2615797.1 hypothetical protein [Nostoc punctiforme FACHB-252]